MSDVRYSCARLGEYASNKRVAEDVVFRTNGYEGPLRSLEAIGLAESVGRVGTNGVVSVEHMLMGNGKFSQFDHAIRIGSIKG